MAFGIAASIIALQVGFRALDVARDSTLASQIMQSEIERLRLMAWSNLATAAVDSILELPAAETVSLSSMFATNAALAAKFTVTRLVAADLARTADIRYITIKVSWNSSDGMPHNRTFTTMYSKNGLYDFYYTVARS